MSSVFSGGDPSDPESQAKVCKWCLRSKGQAAWTRGGMGLECKSDAAYMKYTFPQVKERQKYLEELMADEGKRRLHIQTIMEYEKGGRNPKRKVAVAEEASILEGKTFLGNFWPRAIYESKFEKKLQKKDIFQWDGQQGILLPRDTPTVPGVTEVWSRKQRKAAVIETLAPDGREADGAYSTMTSKLAVKVKQKESEEHGTSFQLSMPGMKQGAQPSASPAPGM